MNTSTKMKFGEWIGAAIKGNSGAKVVKVANSYFDTEALVATATAIDSVAFGAHMESRRFNPLESLAVELLMDLADLKGPKDAHESYQRYLKEEE